MVFNLWSVLLIASASQCVFLMVLFIARPPTNKKALKILMALMLVILAININSLWYAGYLYRTAPIIAGFTRGTMLLLGPLFYFYTRSIIRSDFKFKATQLLHLLPYFAALVMISFQDSPNNVQSAIQMLDRFMAGDLETSTLSLTRYVIYGIHLITYIVFSRREMIESLKREQENYLVSTEMRLNWLNKVNWILVLIAIQEIAFTVYMISIGHHTVFTNFTLTLLFSVLVYMIAYQTIFNANQLLPDFSAKYESVKLAPDNRIELSNRLKGLFEGEKIFTNPNLKVQDVAQRLDVSAHVVSSLINNHMSKSFFELLNHYRIEEFKRIANDPKFSNYSIMGIANEVGYKSKSSFNTAFKKHTGQTPSEFVKT